MTRNPVTWMVLLALSACDGLGSDRGFSQERIGARMISRGEIDVVRADLPAGAWAEIPFDGELLLNVASTRAWYTDDPDACDEDPDDDAEAYDGDDEGDEAGDGDGRWVEVSSVPARVDLAVELRTDAPPLNSDGLRDGLITELRFILDEQRQADWVRDDGEVVPVTVPSGSTSGLKLHGCIPVEDGFDTAISLVGNPYDYLHVASDNGVMLRPSIEVVAEQYEARDE